MNSVSEIGIRTVTVSEWIWKVGPSGPSHQCSVLKPYVHQLSFQKVLSYLLRCWWDTCRV